MKKVSSANNSRFDDKPFDRSLKRKNNGPKIDP